MMLIKTRWFQLSRRGAFLTVFGVVFILLGYSYLNVPAASRPLLHAYLRSALSIAPLDVYGWAWLVCGVLAVIGGLIHRVDWLGFGAAVFMPVLWALAYGLAQVKDHAPRAWVNAVLFAAVAAAIALVASMDDPLDAGRPRRRHRP